jgi:hypothetical protein
MLIIQPSRYVAQVTIVPHDGLAKVPLNDAGRHNGVTGVQMPRMCPILAPITQSGSGNSHLGGGGNTFSNECDVIMIIHRGISVKLHRPMHPFVQIKMLSPTQTLRLPSV